MAALSYISKGCATFTGARQITTQGIQTLCLWAITESLEEKLRTLTTQCKSLFTPRVHVCMHPYVCMYVNKFIICRLRQQIFTDFLVGGPKEIIVFGDMRLKWPWKVLSAAKSENFLPNLARSSKILPEADPKWPFRFEGMKLKAKITTGSNEKNW